MDTPQHKRWEHLAPPSEGHYQTSSKVSDARLLKRVLEDIALKKQSMSQNADLSPPAAIREYVAKKSYPPYKLKRADKAAGPIEYALVDCVGLSVPRAIKLDGRGPMLGH